MKRTQRTLDAQALSVFCEQMLLLTEAGMPLHEGVDALAGEYAGTPQEAAFVAMNEEMKRSGLLADAMAASALFPAWMIGMVRAGEQSGQLERMLRELSAHFERAYQIHGAAVNAVRYPLTLLAVMTLVLLALVFRAAPVFAQAFGSLGVSGAPMLRLSQRVGIGMLVLIALGVLGAAAALAAVRGGKWPKLRAWLLARIPALGRMQAMMTAQKFASVLGVLLASGFPMETALEMLPDVCDTEAEKQRVRICHQQVMEGETIFTAVGNLRLFEPLYLRILRVGFAAGQADAALLKVAKLLSQEIDDTLTRVVSWLEPALVVVLGALIGALLLCVLAPLAGVLGAMA